MRFAERQICRDRDAGSFLAFGDHLEQQLGAAGIERDIAELVQQERVEAAVAAHEAGRLLLAGGSGEFVDDGGGGGLTDSAALLAGGQPEADEQVGLAGPESPSRTTGWPASIQAPRARASRVTAMPGMWPGLWSASRLIRGKRASAMRPVPSSISAGRISAR